MINRTQFNVEITKFFPGINLPNKDAFLDACYNAAEFLSDLNRTRVQLDQFESRLSLKVGTNLSNALLQLKTRTEALKKGDITPKPKTAYSKVLTSEMHAILTTAGGFNDKVPKFVNFVQTTEFNKNLTDNKQWKDPGVNSAHGEFTHQLQWVLIVLAGAGLTQVNTYGASTLFQDIGKVTANIEGTDQGLWQMLFDRGIDPFPAGPNDFREPNKVMDFIFASSDRFPLLSSLLKARQMKRELEFNTALTESKEFFLKHGALLKQRNLATEEGLSHYILWSIKYVTRKKSNTLFGDLPETEQKKVLDIVVGAIMPG